MVKAPLSHLNHHLFKSCQKLLHLCAGADRDAHEVWQGREQATDFDSATAHGVEHGPHLASKINHHEVRMRRNVAVAKRVELRADALLNFAVEFASASNLINILQACERRDERHDVYAVEYLMSLQPCDVCVLCDAVTTPQSGHAVDL